MIPADHRERLDRQGYLKLEGFIAPELRVRLAERLQALLVAEGERAGSEFKQEPGARRLANLVDKGSLFADCIAVPELLAYVGHVIGDRFKLSSLNARSAEPRNGVDQPLHADGGSLPDERGFWVCNTAWMLDEFTPENGAIRVVPGSHRSGRLPEAALADPESAPPGPGGVVWAGGRHAGVQRARLARRAGEPHRPASAGHARLLLPLGQAAALGVLHTASRQVRCFLDQSSISHCCT